MRHRKNGFHERAQYCHVQCFHKEPIEKLSRFETVCSRCHSVIEATTPIEKYGTKWVHRGCKEISNAVIVSESSSSYSYEQLLKASLIFEDELFPSGGTDSQQTFESSQQSQQLSIDIQQYSQLTSDTTDKSRQTSDHSLPDVNELQDKVLTKRKSSVDTTTVNKKK